MSGHTASEGGGLYHREDSAGTLTLTDSTVSGNVAHGSGGGLYNLTGPVTLTDSTVSGNVASQGGGINQGVYTLMLTNCTLSGNTASEGGGLSIIGGG
jgi:hypothetical protein